VKIETVAHDGARVTYGFDPQHAAALVAYYDGLVKNGEIAAYSVITNALGIAITSVFLECRQWRDKPAGETYTSARLWINGRAVAYLPLQYGGLENMEDTAGLYLERVGVLPGPDGYRHLARRLRELGTDYYTATEWRTRRETWRDGESLTAEELREELAATYYRAVAI
jgi:hypothetical protein